MYAALIRQRFAEWRRQVWHATLVRSGAITMVAMAMVLLVLAFGWREHKKGRFALLKAELKRPAPSRVAPPPQPGGQDAIVLERTPIGASTMPEFLSATVLPGRGMNVLQIRAFVPSKGEVELLASPPLADAATIMSGAGADTNGAASLTLGAPIEVPWAGRIYGTASETALSQHGTARAFTFPLNAIAAFPYPPAGYSCEGHQPR